MYFKEVLTDKLVVLVFGIIWFINFWWSYCSLFQATSINWLAFSGSLIVRQVLLLYIQFLPYCWLELNQTLKKSSVQCLVLQIVESSGGDMFFFAWKMKFVAQCFYTRFLSHDGHEYEPRKHTRPLYVIRLIHLIDSVKYFYIQCNLIANITRLISFLLQIIFLYFLNLSMDFFIKNL